MAYLRPSILRFINIRDFLLYFCVAYTCIDVTGAIVTAFNHIDSGLLKNKPASALVSDSNTNSIINLVITVKPVQ